MESFELSDKMISFLFFLQTAWLNPKKILIATSDRRTMDDTRLSIERPLIPDWNLHIRTVRYEDRGMYLCTLNTKPVTVKRIYLSILGMISFII